MRSEYDFSHSRKNPYVKQLKRQIDSGHAIAPSAGAGLKPAETGQEACPTNQFTV
jgi:hypothetical protein